MAPSLLCVIPFLAQYAIKSKVEVWVNEKTGKIILDFACYSFARFEDNMDLEDKLRRYILCQLGLEDSPLRLHLGHSHQGGGKEPATNHFSITVE